jgi:hypothetical protein
LNAAVIVTVDRETQVQPTEVEGSLGVKMDGLMEWFEVDDKEAVVATYPWMSSCVPLDY